MHPVPLASLRVNCCYYAAPGPPSWSVPSGPPSGPPAGSPAGSGVVDSSSAAWSTDPVLLTFEVTLLVSTRPPSRIIAAIANNAVIFLIFFMVRQLLKLPQPRRALRTPHPIDILRLSC